ncbi:sulfite reductase (NADPH) flavoprotein alpha-component [Polaribacter sp. KT25b]|uniref:PepSY domain-containing protein n=1 Tax=Polaribacter sp. KT25b TaxID=1855336 RepID=UPI00087C9305|nr:PepSY domain-containing protein [Polaribacter sp. KT25b]SDR76820.1 sulfite reductase (NADPH) flavoprotein alpha-component [Polaribacter sp. KT25b]
MTISIWRYSHLTLAISSVLFIIIASITGIILAFEPISEKLNPYNIVSIDAVSVSETLSVLNEKYDEIITLEIDENNFVSANVVLKDGKSDTFYINPKTGEKISEILEKKPIFEFATNLHRSLFLKSTGRFIIGFVSFLLFLISATGVILIAKRQGGFSKFFSKIIKEDFNQYYHIIIGRYTLIPIVIITITGVYLSLEKFSLLPKDTSSHQNITQKKNASNINLADFEFFKSTKLDEVKKIEFPFSKDEEDYFFVKLANKEVAIQQFTGQIVSQKKEPLVAFGSYYSLLLHTGKGSILWSIVLLLACFAILFFVFSGFSMSLKRKKNKFEIKNKFHKDEVEFIILVGSETGSTFNFANAFYNALLIAGKSVYLSDLNQYTTYEKAENIIIFAATYGEGEAPVNATKFIKLIEKTYQKRILKLSVIGFGSKSYKEYCKFAILVQASLQLHQKFVPILPLFKINNQSFVDFENWLKEWSSFYKLNLLINQEDLDKKNFKEQIFTVINKPEINIDDTFLIELKPSKKIKFESGDLLSITPKGETRSRLYSIAKIDNTILLSIKKHEFGLCSNNLNNLNKKDIVVANIQKNENFHFPKKAKGVILIANGTGIAPFLGMINEKKSKGKVHLFWGGRTKKSLEIYKNYINTSLENKALTSFNAAFSQEQKEKFYVQDLLKNHSDLIANTLKSGGEILICGSLSMQKGVTELLSNITENSLKKSLKAFKENYQIKTDCY